MLFYTGQTRHASEVVQEQIDKTKARANDPYLHRMREMVYEAEELISTLPADQMVPAIGNLLCESWRLKKQLSSKISNSLIDQAHDAALAAGAYGGKLCGAGSGGFLALLAPPEKQEHIRTALKGMLEVRFRFESEGSTIIYMKD
jgi:D-glycero-alpha-D-manno-heptose-7-phosphate kinase